MKKLTCNKIIWLFGGTGIVGSKIYSSLSENYKVLNFHKDNKKKDKNSVIIDFQKIDDLKKLVKKITKDNLYPDFIITSHRFRNINDSFEDLINAIKTELGLLYFLTDYFLKKKRGANFIILNSNASNQINTDIGRNYNLTKKIIKAFIDYNTVISKKNNFYQITFGEILIQKNHLRNKRIKRIYKDLGIKKIKVENIVKLINLIIQNYENLPNNFEYDYGLNKISTESLLRQIYE